MKAWSKRDGALRLVDVPVPEPGTDELLVRVQATSLNRGEARTVARAAEGTVPGWDVAGTVERAARNGKGAPKGARVSAFVSGGAWAEFVCIPAAQAAIVPDAVDLEVAATLPIAGLTVLRAFEIAGSILGRSLLVTGGSGGVGQIAIQLGTSAGAVVTAISSRDSQRDALRKLGAHDVVPTIDAAKGPFDLILESVGGASLATAIDRVARGGVIVTIGNSSEEETTFNARTLYAKGGATIYGLLIFEEVGSRRVRADHLERLFALVEAGKLTPPIQVRKSWMELPSVLAGLERGAYAGKAVLTFDSFSLPAHPSRPALR
ncbi:MAG TPA: zinc-binding dehydrogenase [Thermoanaerobaculia bacterium]|nr:zinc-binding dehydrogenase [Thermoanaerobaculia bacterium]